MRRSYHNFPRVAKRKPRDELPPPKHGIRPELLPLSDVQRKRGDDIYCVALMALSSASKLNGFAGVSEAGGRRRNPERFPRRICF
jgi:hypothetical protein